MLAESAWSIAAWTLDSFFSPVIQWLEHTDPQSEKVRKNNNKTKKQKQKQDELVVFNETCLNEKLLSRYTLFKKKKKRKRNVYIYIYIYNKIEVK